MENQDIKFNLLVEQGAHAILKNTGSFQQYVKITLADDWEFAWESLAYIGRSNCEETGGQMAVLSVNEQTQLIIDVEDLCQVQAKHS